MSAKNKPVNNKDSRPTIGVIVDSMISSYQTSLWRSIKTACKERDLNAICFVGREIFIDSDYQFHKQANAIYKLVNKNNLDGLILLTGTISHFVDEVELETYLQKFQPLPMVSIAETVTNIPSIVLDNHAGIHEIVAHLVKEHQYRKIGYVRMREGHAEGNIRFEAFKDALETHNIPYDPELIVPGDYYNQPEAIIQLLYDERKVKPEALVVSDDFMAIPIIEALQNRGIAVPADVAIVGFDDVEEARYIDPPLTTMRQPLWEQAIQAVEIILTALNENTVPQVIEMSPTLIVRQSCGCTPVGILSAAAPILDEAPKAESLSAYKKEILTSLMEFAEFTTEQSVQALVEALIVAVENNASESYLASLTKILRQSETRDEDILGWQIIISALRPFILNILLQSKSALIQAENLLQQSRVMIAETARSYQAKRRLKMQEHNLGLQYLSQALNTTMNFEELLQTLDQGLPGLGVPEFYISVYEQNNPDTEYVRLVLAHTDQETPPLPPGGLRYNAVDLLPSGFRKGNSRGQKFVQPLYFRDEQYGFAIFEDQAYSESLFDTLAQQISSSLKGISLIQQVERRAVQLETAAEVSQAASSILEPEDLIQQSVNLVKDRFDLYYVGLFLADEERHWAELRAGTGEPGEKMLAINWRLEIGGESMIGRCVETGEPDIQLDIDKAPIHLRNPYLPETKSELALPMRSRGEVLGALTIQSASANAFSAEDVSILQTMADQLANAIGNAYLYNALAREQYLMDALMDNMPEAIYFKDKDSKFLRISRFMVNNFGVEKPSEIIGKTDFDFFTPEHAQPAFDNEQEIIKTGEPLLNIEELETWEDRPDTWGMTSKLPLRNERGEIIGTFGITRDITELKTIQIAQENQSKQLQTTIEVSRAISEILDPQELSSQIVNLIKEQFGFYYVGFFEVNEFGDQAVLRSGSGEAGQKMVESNWRLDIDNNSMIGQCMLSGQPDIQLDIDKAPAHLRNPYLPDTKSEMALPLFSRAEVLGALTIQSDKANAFTTEDITVLQTMANQISVALSNAHLFEETQNALMETETLLNVSRLASSSVGIDFAMPQILDLILKSTQIDAGLFSLANRNTKQLELTTSQIPEQLEKTLRQRGFNGTLCDLVYQQKEPIILNDLETYSPIDAQGLIKMGFLSYQGVPIETRGEIYGTLCTFSKFKLRPEDSRINLLQALGQQISVAIENARLFEQTQAALAETERQASRLFALNEISEKLSQANTLDEIYQAGASQLAQIIAADRISFALLKDDGKNAELLTVSGESGIAPTGSIISLEGSSIEKAIESKRPVIVNNPLPSESE